MKSTNRPVYNIIYIKKLKIKRYGGFDLCHQTATTKQKKQYFCCLPSVSSKLVGQLRHQLVNYYALMAVLVN